MGGAAYKVGGEHCGVKAGANPTMQAVDRANASGIIGAVAAMGSPFPSRIA